MDPVSTYGGTGRELVLGFRVVSDSIEEARQNMLNIEKLIQFQYPSYQNASGGTKIMNAPPYFEISFLNLLNSTRTKGSRLTGYINGAVQINPGFQSKEQAQFFNSGFSKIYFSDVTITLRMQVLHEGAIGWTSNRFSHGNYPYNVGSNDALPVQTPTESRQARKNEAAAASDAGVAAVNKPAETEKKDKNKNLERTNNVARRRNPADYQKAAAAEGASDVDYLIGLPKSEFNERVKTFNKLGISATRPLREKPVRKK
jgi:hypothetical protein